MDIVYIHGLEVSTVIGIRDWEREVRQLVRMDVEMAADVAGPAAADDIAAALDYHLVAKRLARFAEESRFDLVETLAERAAALLMREFELPWLRLKVAKPGAVRGSQEVGVIVERGQRPGGSAASVADAAAVAGATPRR